MSNLPLTNEDTYERLVQALNALPNPDLCETIEARTAIEAARTVLVNLQIALLKITEKDAPLV